MIMNQTPYPISFEREMSQALVCRYGEEMRQYVFKPDIDVSGLSCLLQIAKTDGTFTENGVEVHTDPDTGECTLVITIPQQATVVKGLNRYSICVYGDIEGENHLLYSAEGPLWVDDDLITDEMIASVAEINGLVFPQDFLTVENLVDIVNYVAAGILNDNTISTETTWSSDKINQEIEGHNPDIDVSKEVTGNPIEFSDGAAAPLVKCVTQITGYQEGTGTPSPDNIRPIVAYTDGEIEVRGKNIFNATINQYNANNILTGAVLIPKGTYTCSIVWNGTLDGLYFHKSYDVTSESIARAYNSNVLTYTFEEDTTIYIQGLKNNGVSVSDVKIQIEKGSVATSYEEPNITTHTTTYPSAIYRGSEDVVNGTETHDMECIDLGDLTWVREPTAIPDLYRFYAPLTNVKTPATSAQIANILCSGYETVSADYTYLRRNGIAIKSSGAVSIYDDNYNAATAEAFAIAIAGIQLAYELATPTTSSVTPTNLPIKSLSGYNHIESSTGNLELEYILQNYDPITELITRSSLHVYGSEERVVGKWVNNEPLYERFIDFSNININSGVSDYKYRGNLMIKSIIPDANIILPDLQHSYYVVNSVQFSFIGFRINCDTGELVVVTLFAVNNADLHICLQYTKSNTP